MKKESATNELLPEYDFSTGVRGRYAGRFYPVGPWHVGDQVVLERNVPEHRLKKGDVGQVSHRYEGGGAFRVRFDLASGETAAEIEVAAPDLRSRGPDEILRVRSRD